MLNPDEAEFWSDFSNLHDPDVCVAPCIVHSPTDHHMRTWPLFWRWSRGVAERICTHGVGHPDPDQFAYWERTDQSWQSTHGCCGCCNRQPVLF